MNACVRRSRENRCLAKPFWEYSSGVCRPPVYQTSSRVEEKSDFWPTMTLYKLGYLADQELMVLGLIGG